LGQKSSLKSFPPCYSQSPLLTDFTPPPTYGTAVTASFGEVTIPVTFEAWLFTAVTCGLCGTAVTDTCGTSVTETRSAVTVTVTSGAAVMGLPVA
jgi:hypothetical protein